MNDDRVQLSATLYIKEYGPEAAKLATQNVATLLSHGDNEGAADWSRVVEEIKKRTGVVRLPQPETSS